MPLKQIPFKQIRFQFKSNQVPYSTQSNYVTDKFYHESYSLVKNVAMLIERVKINRRRKLDLTKERIQNLV